MSGLGWWFGIAGVPLSNNPFHRGIPGIQTTNPNHKLTITLPETNIAPENRPSQKESSIPTIHFQVLC